MLLIRTYKKFLLVVSLLLSSGWLYAQDMTEFRTLLKSFISEIPVLSSLEIADELLENLTFIDEKNQAVSVSKNDKFLCSLVIIPVPEDLDSDIAAELDVITQNRALIEAQMRLAFYIGQGGVDRKLFRYDDALGTALLAYYNADIKNKKLRGIETAASVVDKKKFAAGIAWISPETAEIIGNDIPEHGELDDNYCRFLYRNHALILFEANRFEEALPVFKNIHDFKWSDVNAYLDASECFLRTGANEDCIRLLKELILTLNEKMTSENLRRSGTLFREAGDKESAKDSFVRARRRFHDENKKGL